jgi:hypothetical protein
MGSQPSNRKGVRDEKGQPRPEDLSTVELHGMDHVAQRQELLNLAHNHIEKNRNPGDDVRVEDQGNTIIYRLTEKNLALSLAKNIAAAYKGNRPEMIVHNPDQNEFYRITVLFMPRVM